MNEQELLNAIQKAEEDRKIFKRKITLLKQEINERESDLIEASIRKDRLIERLRVHKSTVPRYLPDEREKEIQAFKEVFPELSKKIDAEKKL